MTRKIDATAGTVLDRLTFHRSASICAHVALGIAAAFMYMAVIDLGHFAYWRRGAATGAVIIGSVATIPCLVSGLASYRLVSPKRVGFWIFIAILVLGTGLGGCWYMSPAGQGFGSAAPIVPIVGQLLLFANAAKWYLGRKAFNPLS
jgi:hypothetical protein